jgi:aminoglycoside phosphotransferase family enzyme
MPGEIELSAKIDCLSRPQTYSARPASVETIETHFAWVFVAGERVYKLKKPLRFHEQDFTTLAARRANCELELALNRRLAPTVYLGIVPLCEQRGGLALGGPGTPVEWLVEMRYLPRELSLDRLAADGRVAGASLDALLGKLARFYADAVRAPWDGRAYRAALATDTDRYCRELGGPAFGLDARRVEELEARLDRFVATHAAELDSRISAARVVDSHGDLRPEHVFLTPEPQVIDCLEFSAELRLQDSAAELAFLALECDRLGHTELAARLLALYRNACSDDVSTEMLAFYRARQALIRALISAWHLEPPGVPGATATYWRARAHWYLDAALAATAALSYPSR